MNKKEFKQSVICKKIKSIIELLAKRRARLIETCPAHADEEDRIKALREIALLNKDLNKIVDEYKSLYDDTRWNIYTNEEILFLLIFFSDIWTDQFSSGLDSCDILPIVLCNDTDRLMHMINSLESGELSKMITRRWRGVKYTFELAIPETLKQLVLDV